MKNILRDNGLSLTLFGCFLLFTAGMSVAGWLEYNETQRQHMQPASGYIAYLVTGHFLEALFENWESEFLQMGAYVSLTAMLFQRGSAESKDPDKQEEVDEDPARHRNDPDAPGPVKRGGWLLRVYCHSLSLAFLLLFLVSFAAHAVSGLKEYNAEQLKHGEPPASLTEYITGSKFWFESLQNWQSEFLAVGAMVLLSVWLRQKGSPESKPVFKPHAETGA